MKRSLLLFLVVLIATLTRIVQLGTTPSSLYWEEAALGYDAYSIWKTGRDYHGHPWPLVAFESFGDFKPSGYFYLAAPFVGFFGLNTWSVRLPSALAGIITVYLVYRIAKELNKSESVSLMSALALAIMPWHIHFSRAAFEVNVATMWLCAGLLYLLKSKRDPRLLIPASLFLVLSAYTYHGLRILGPLIAGSYILSFGNHFWRSKWLYISGLLSILLMFPILINIREPQVSKRFAETSMFSTSTAVVTTNQLRDEDGSTLISRMIHHRYLEWTREIVAGSLDHANPVFLFLEGDSNQRHQTGYTALLSWWMIIPLVVALLDKKSIPYLAWIILATLPTALTNLTPHTLRFLPAAPAFAILVGVGLYKIKKRFGYLATWLLGLTAVGSLLFYQFDYYTSYKIRSAAEWQYGYKEVVDFIQSYANQSLPVQVTRAYGRPSIYFLYYLNYNPTSIQAAAPSAPKDQAELLAFDRYYFGPIDTSMPSLIVNNQPLEHGTLLHTIYFPDRKPAFYIYEI